MGFFVCDKCGTKKTTFYKYTKHLKLYHEFEANCIVICKFDNCKMAYKSIRLLVRHVNKKHLSSVKVMENNANSNDGDGESDMEIDNNLTMNVEGDLNTLNEDEHTVDLETIVLKKAEEFKLYVAKCALSLKERHILSATVQQNILGEMKFLLEQTLEFYQMLFTHFCNEIQVPLPTDGVYKCLFDDTSVFCKVFDELDSENKLFNFISEKFNYIKPTERILHRNPTGRNAVYQYVPIQPVLETYLKNKSIRCEMQLDGPAKNFDSDGIVYKSFTDGSAFINHPFFSIYNNALRLHFYIDEFEVCNPLGAKRGKYKTIGVYYIIGNVHPKHLSQVKFINLSILTLYRNVTEFDDNYETLFD